MPSLFGKGQRVGSSPESQRYVIVRRIGEGRFAEVYVVCDTQEGDVQYAMKVEKHPEARSIKQEYKVMRRLNETCPQVCPVVCGGVLHQQQRSYMVMQLLGNNLSEYRRACKGGRLEPDAVRHIGNCMLDALQAVHAAGYIHRDVKPANIAQVLGSTGAGEWRLLDFGLARRYMDEQGTLLPARPDAQFRGSTTYASVHAHAGNDLSRRDDMWSWLYCLVELAEGTLPWRMDGSAAAAAQAATTDVQPLLPPAPGPPQDNHRVNVGALKQACISQPQRLARHTPIAGLVTAITQHLVSLDFAGAPDYGLLRALLAQHLHSTWEPNQQQQQQEGVHMHAASPLLTPTPGPHSGGMLHAESAHAAASGRCMSIELPPPPPLAAGAEQVLLPSTTPIPQRAFSQPGIATMHQQPPQQPVQGVNTWPHATAVPETAQLPGSSFRVQREVQVQHEGGGLDRVGVGGEAGGMREQLDLDMDIEPAPVETPAGAQTPPSDDGLPGTSHKAAKRRKFKNDEAERVAIRNMSQYMTSLASGASGPYAESLGRALAALHPIDTMAVIGGLLGTAVNRTPAEGCAALSALLTDVALYAGAAARNAGHKHADWLVLQEAQQQQGVMPPQQQQQQHHNQQQQQQQHNQQQETTPVQPPTQSPLHHTHQQQHHHQQQQQQLMQDAPLGAAGRPASRQHSRQLQDGYSNERHRPNGDMMRTCNGAQESPHRSPLQQAHHTPVVGGLPQPMANGQVLSAQQQGGQVQAAQLSPHR